MFSSRDPDNPYFQNHQTAEVVRSTANFFDKGSLGHKMIEDALKKQLSADQLAEQIKNLIRQQADQIES